MPKGQIMKALSGFYYVKDEGRIIQCRGRGVFRNQGINPLVGDLVEYQAENDQEGYIMDISERKNELVRPPIANVDQAILVFSAVEPDFSTSLLDRFLVLVESKDILPIICITKMDLLPVEKVSKIEAYVSDYEKMGYDVIQTSSETLSGLNILRPFLANKISVFAGQSGVGKSSLLNALRPDLELKTDDISSHLGRGKHTTRHVELIPVEDGLVADTPGFSSLDFTDLEVEDLTYTFLDIRELSQHCKFRGCIHINEPKCAVKTAVDNKSMPSYRYDHYLQFVKEIQDRKPRY